MPKNIAAFLDGTWNNAVSTDTPQTNVYALFQSVARENQIKSYYPGVGAHTGWLGNFLYGATGKGVFQAARLAWQQISANYEDGDKVFIFGFSRGAYAARHLAGMIVRHGLRGWQGNIEETFRQWQANSGKPCALVRQEVHFLGLFDCVPGNHLYVWRDRSAHLNAAQLEPGIQHVRHAVSLHERRWSFRPLIFEPSEHHKSFAQHWFPGFHSDVGGGDGVADGLASFSLWWMLREAYGLGLAFDNVDCSSHRYGHALGVLRSVNPRAVPVCSDYWTTRMGLHWNRPERQKVVAPEPTPAFESLDICPRCGKEMFDLFLTDFGQQWLRSKGLLGNNDP
jgi:uncharacterized protein (DUF2235 family)